jgi:deoxyribodipyrimidine photo-lyase
MSALPVVPRLRLLVRNDRPLRPHGDHVLYWMTSARRTRWNHALDRAVALAHDHGRPLVVLEALRCDAPWASERTHRFVVDGMADNAARFAAAGVAYHPYVEPSRSAGRGLLAALAERAVTVVTDEFPTYFLPRMVEAAAATIASRLESVDSNGLLPLRATDHAYPTAYAFRRHLQATLLPHLAESPSPDPLAAAGSLPRAAIPSDVAARWPRASDDLLAGRGGMSSIAVDRTVPAAAVRGGPAEGERVLDRFVEHGLARYGAERNHPDHEGTSGLSPYLHFGHVGAHQVFARIAEVERWRPPDRPRKPTGSREGWWGVSPDAEAFLDQVVTWRELGYQTAFHRADHDRYESLPDWALRTLDAHRGDARPYVYGPEQLDAAATHDPLWNAGQRQLVREGRMHNYVRMLWGKKVLEWSPTPEAAVATLIHLNNRYALDGRDPNSYSGIFWCLGRYDRPWGPERAVFGTVRYMSSASAARKLHLDEYLRRHGARTEES